MPGSDDLVAHLRRREIARLNAALASRDKEIERLTKERDEALANHQWAQARLDHAEALAATAARERDEARAEVERLRKRLEPFARAARAMPKDDPGPFPLYSLTGYRQITRSDLDGALSALHPEGGEHGR